MLIAAAPLLQAAPQVLYVEGCRDNWMSPGGLDSIACPAPARNLLIMCFIKCCFRAEFKVSNTFPEPASLVAASG